MATIDTPPVGDIPFVGDQIAEQDQADAASGAGDADRRRAKRSKLLRPIMWRLHFVGGFLAGPVVLSLAITGILFAWSPQIDGLRFGDAIKPSSGQVRVPLADQVRAAQAKHPDWGVHSVIPGHAVPGSNDLNTAVVMDPPGGEDGFSAPADAVDVYVDQATGKVDRRGHGDEQLRHAASGPALQLAARRRAAPADRAGGRVVSRQPDDRPVPVVARPAQARQRGVRVPAPDAGPAPEQGLAQLHRRRAHRADVLRRRDGADVDEVLRPALRDGEDGDPPAAGGRWRRHRAGRAPRQARAPWRTSTRSSGGQAR